MDFIERRASGTRHLRWLKAILVTGRAHLKLNRYLTEKQKAALTEALARIEAEIARLAAANAPYRAFVDGAYTESRASQRVANYLCDVPLEEATSTVRGKRRDAEAVVPGILARLTAKLPLSRALRLGHERTVEVVRGAADAIALLPADQFAFAAPMEKSLDAAADLLAGLIQQQKDEIDPKRAPLRNAVEKAIIDARETLQQVNGQLRSHFPASFIDSLYPELEKGGTTGADDEDDDAPPADGPPTA